MEVLSSRDKRCTCRPLGCRRTYHLQLLENNLRALAMATQSFLRVNKVGILNIAHKIITDGGGQLFVSFTFMPDEDMTEEDGGEDGDRVFGAAKDDSNDAASTNGGRDVNDLASDRSRY